jgi:hypothetical protein
MRTSVYFVAVVSVGTYVDIAKFLRNMNCTDPLLINGCCMSQTFTNLSHRTVQQSTAQRKKIKTKKADD